MKSTQIQIAFVIMIVVIFNNCNGGKTKKSRFDNIPATDTTCLKEVEIAKKHFAEEKLVYCNNAGSLLYISLRSEKEMRKLLQEYNIDYKNEITSDLVIYGQTQFCYCDFMLEKIAEKYGENFIDSLLNVSDSLFVFQNPLDTFYYAECDTRPCYPNENENREYSSGLQSEFEKIVKYPKGYIENEEDPAFVNVSFIVNKEGKASVTFFWSLFSNQHNKKYEKYFEKLITPLIENTKWQPATIRNQQVISDMVIRIYLN
jgi:DNA-dependent RNA polymerase auxiliary subunit epsilon